MATRWTTVLKHINKPGPTQYGLRYFIRSIRDIRDAGFKLADEDISKAFDKLKKHEFPFTQYDKPLMENSLFHLEQTSDCTYCKVQPFLNWGIYHTHARSEDVFGAADNMARHFRDDIKKRRVWLLPVHDDQEYISWSFHVITGTKRQVIKKLEEANKHVAAVTEDTRKVPVISTRRRIK